LSVFFALLGSARAKAAHRTLMKLTLIDKNLVMLARLQNSYFKYTIYQQYFFENIFCQSLYQNKTIVV
jgi:hypothetical protein